MPLQDDIDDIIEPIITVLRNSLNTMIQGHLVRAFIRGDFELVSWGKTKAGIAVTYEGPPIQQAINWARKHCATLVTKMDDETKSRLAQVVSEAIENKRGIPGLAKEIRNEFDNMTRYRSQMVARTETANALEEAFMQRAKDMGVDGKEWVATGDACEICLANEDEGVVPIDHIFSSGDERPPAHPNCICALAPARLAAREE